MAEDARTVPRLDRDDASFSVAIRPTDRLAARRIVGRKERTDARVDVEIAIRLVEYVEVPQPGCDRMPAMHLDPESNVVLIHRRLSALYLLDPIPPADYAPVLRPVVVPADRMVQRHNPHSIPHQGRKLPPRRLIDRLPHVIEY